MKKGQSESSGAGTPSVLVVEDERIVAGDIESRLTILGYRVIGIVPSGEEAISATAQLKPDIVLMDIHLEGEMDGTAAARAILTGFDVPVVYLTAHADNSTLQRAKTTDPFGYLLKPFDDHELRTAIELALYKHQTARLLRESEARFRGLADTMPAGILLYRNNTLIYANKHVEPLSGYTVDELMSMDIFDVAHPDARATLREKLAARERGEEIPSRYEFRIVRKDGTERWVDFSSTSLTVGGVRSWLWTAFDITERKQAEEQRRSLEAALAQVQKMDSIGTLVAGLAHHFNNLLAIIQGYAQRLERTPGEASRVSQSARAIDNAAHRGVALIQQLIGVTRKANIQFAPIPVNILIKELTVLMREVFPSTVEFVHDLAPANLQIAGEYHQLHQALMNICLNARDAMPEGGTLTLSSSLLSGSTLRSRSIQADAVDYVRIAITDTGVGMGDDVRDHIYEPFFTTKDRALHTGMGMSVVYGIVASHRGYVEVESAGGKGTTVSVYLPAFVAQGSRPATEPAPDRKGATILLVEDETMLRGLMREVLEREGFAVLEASDGEEAFTRFERDQSSIGLVLLDLGLPRLAGDMLFRKLRAVNPQLPIILSTGFIRKEQADEALRVSADAVIQKPFTVAEFIATVRQTLERRSD